MRDHVIQTLASGQSGLVRWVRLGAALPSLSLALLAVVGFMHGMPVLGVIASLLAVILGLPAVAAMRQRAEAPSDIRIDGEGLMVIGGRLDGLRVSWSDLSPDSVILEEGRERRLTVVMMFGHTLFLLLGALLSGKAELAPDDGDPTATLKLALRDGRVLELARGVEHEEVESLKALAGAIEERLRPGEQTDAAPPEAVRCGSCGAPAKPCAGEKASCDFCGAEVPMPEGLRRRIAELTEAGETRARVEELTAALVAPPAARSASRAVAAVFAAVGVLSAVTLLLLVLLLAADAADGFALGTAAVATGLLVLSAWAFGARLVTHRRASGVIGALFGARAPRLPEEGWSCRSCGAPLPEVSGAVVSCAYCNAANVVGLGSGGSPSPTRRHELDLAAEVEARAARRRSVRNRMIAATVGGGLSLLLVVVLMGSAFEDLERRRACNAGDGKACYLVGLGYFTGAAGRQDHALALEYYMGGCALGAIPGCCGVLSYVEIDWGTRPPAAAVDTARGWVEAARAATGGADPCAH